MNSEKSKTQEPARADAAYCRVPLTESEAERLSSLLPKLHEQSKKSEWGRLSSTLYEFIDAGPSSVPPLLRFVRTLDEDSRRSVSVSISMVKEPSAIPFMIAILDEGENPLADSAANALGKMKASAAVPSLLNTLKSPERFSKEAAAEALGKIGDPSTVPALIAALNDPCHFQFRRTVAEAILKIEHTPHISCLPELLSALRQESIRNFLKDSNVKSAPELEYISWALEQFGKQIIPQLVAALREENNTLRNTVSNKLERHGSAAIPLLLAELENGNEFSRNEATALLGRIGARSAIPGIISGILSRRISLGLAASALGDLSSEALYSRRSAIGEIAISELREFRSAIRALAKNPDEEVERELPAFVTAYRSLVSQAGRKLALKYEGVEIPPRIRPPRSLRRDSASTLKKVQRMVSA